MQRSLSNKRWRIFYRRRESFYTIGRFNNYTKFKIHISVQCTERDDVSPSVNMVAFVTCRLAFTRTAFNYEHVPCSVFIFFFFFFFFFYFPTFRIARWHQRVANSFCQFERTFHTHGNDEINRPKWRFNYRESWVLHAARFLGTLVHEEPGQTSLIIY